MKALKQCAKALVILLCVALLVLGGILLKLFVIGETKQVNTIVVVEHEISGDRVVLQTLYATSADVMARYSHTCRDGVLSIKVTSVLVGVFPVNDTIDIQGDFTDLQKVVLTDGKEEKIVWERGIDPPQETG